MHFTRIIAIFMAAISANANAWAGEYGANLEARNGGTFDERSSMKDKPEMYRLGEAALQHFGIKKGGKVVYVSLSILLVACYAS